MQAIPSHVVSVSSVLLLIFAILEVHTASDDIILAPQSVTTYILNLSKLSLNYNITTCYISMVSTSQGRTIFNKSLQQMQHTSHNSLKRLQLHNYQPTSQSIKLSIQINQSTQLSLFSSQMVMESATAVLTPRYILLLIKSNIENYMLPFNFVSEKYLKIVVEESATRLDKVGYDYQPFLDTFWNQHGENQVLIQWLPYFSNCQYGTKGRIYLERILQPWDTDDYKINNIETRCHRDQSWFWGNALICQDKSISTKCFLEQTNVKNSKKQPWWLNTGQTLFYLLKPELVLNSESLLKLQSSLSLSSLAQQYYSSLTPVEYSPQFSLTQQIPNYFRLQFKVSTIKDVKRLKILSIKLQASRNEELANSLQHGQAMLNINVDYLSNQETLGSYGKQIYTYALIFNITMLFIILIAKLLFYFFGVNLHFQLLSKLVIFPILKGFLMAFFIASSFMLFFFFIADSTNYKAISSNFNNDAVEDTWNSSAGRVGLSMFFVGYFLLNTGVQQSFKVLTVEQTKIIIEDDILQKNPSQAQNTPQVSPQAQQPQTETKPKFIIKNMNSQRKYLFISLFSYSFLLLLLYYIQPSFNLTQKLLFLLLAYPFIYKLTITIYRHWITKQLLYLSPILVAFNAFSDCSIIGNMKMEETIVVYFGKIVAEILCIVFEICTQWMAAKVYMHIENYDGNARQNRVIVTCLYRFFNYFRNQIKSVVTECRYQKSIYYANLVNIRFVSVLVRPFFILLVFISIKYNVMCKDLNQSQQQLAKTSLILVTFIPMQLLLLLISYSVFQSPKVSLQFIKCLQFNKFKFLKRKVKWLNDSFAQNRSIQHFYRQFQKFCFSSQLYLLFFLIAFSKLCLIFGLKIMLEVDYVCFLDPAMLIILIVVWLVGNLSGIIISFVLIKLKFYQRKQDGKMRGKIENVQKILKKIDYSQYLQVEAVKNYFLFHCKEWIVQNITKIFDKQDFFDNNYQFLLKYKNYKSLLKKKQIEARKKQQKNCQKLIQSDHNIKKSQQQKIPNNLINHYSQKPLIVRLPHPHLQQIAIPLLTSWLYIAKQFTFLKSLTHPLLPSHKKQSCQFCSMNIQLEVIEKIQFANIVNQYRILNVGRIFDQIHFIRFYQLKQQYITVCIQCKDRKLYLEKKCLDIGGAPRRLLAKWLIISRSRLLHQNRQNKEIQDKKNIKQSNQ